MQQMMLLACIENPSATERLRAVSNTKELHEANDQGGDGPAEHPQ